MNLVGTDSTPSLIWLVPPCAEKIRDGVESVPTGSWSQCVIVDSWKLSMIPCDGSCFPVTAQHSLPAQTTLANLFASGGHRLLTRSRGLRCPIILASSPCFDNSPLTKIWGSLKWPNPGLVNSVFPGGL